LAISATVPGTEQVAEHQMSILDRLQELLDETLNCTGLPGAVVAVLADGRLHEAASGVINTHTAVPCTPDSLFMFGSVTKAVTATMALTLIEKGLLDRDGRVRDIVPEFRPAGDADAISIAQLMTHSSGLIGSIFEDTGQNADTLARQVQLISAAPVFHAPGQYLSYCNSGYVLLGRAIEMATGQSWNAAVRSITADTLGIDSIVNTAGQALRFSTAVGHVIDPETSNWVPIADPFANPGHAPAGSTMAGRARDLVHLASGYLDARFLSESMVGEAWSVQVPALVPGALRGWGLGWMIFDWGGQKVVGHDGSTAGTKSYLRVVPDKGLAIAILVNAQAGFVVYDAIMGALFDELVGAWEASASDMELASVADIQPCVGTYADSHLRIEVSIDGEAASGAIMPNSSNPIHRPVLMTYPVVPCGENKFYTTGQAVIFYPPAKHLDTKLVRVSQLATTSDGDTFLCNGANIYRKLEDEPG